MKRGLRKYIALLHSTLIKDITYKEEQLFTTHFGNFHYDNVKSG